MAEAAFAEGRANDAALNADAGAAMAGARVFARLGLT